MSESSILNHPDYTATYGEPYDDTNPDLPTDAEWREFMEDQDGMEDYASWAEQEQERRYAAEDEAYTLHLWRTR